MCSCLTGSGRSDHCDTGTGQSCPPRGLDLIKQKHYVYFYNKVIH